MTEVLLIFYMNQFISLSVASSDSFALSTSWLRVRREWRKRWYFQGSINSYHHFPPLAAFALAQHMNTVPIQKLLCGQKAAATDVESVGNYKRANGKLQGPLHVWNTVPIHAVHRQEMSVSDSCLDLYVRKASRPGLFSSPAHSLVLSASICFHISSAEECASQQYLMKVWLTGRCRVHVSVFSCFLVCTRWL